MEKRHPRIADNMQIESSKALWHSLGQSLKQGNVIPVIGPGALEVVFEEPGGKARTGLFYRFVAEALLGGFGLDPPPGLLDDPWALQRAFSVVLEASSKPERKIRLEVASLVDEYEKIARPAESLKSLAGMASFSLFVSLTPDKLLEQALRGPDETMEVRVGAYSPSDASETVASMTLPRRGERGVFQLFGSCANVGGGFAMHEEDALEYLFLLQSGAARRFTGLLSELRRRDLLFIGCGFPDWLGRAMLRLVNENRLSAKDSQEFLCPGVDDPGLSAFLSRYSPYTLSFPGSSTGFVQEMVSRFGGDAKPDPQPGKRLGSSAPAGPTVFVSYASQNAEAARKIADTLLTLGFGDVWLDKKKLKGGDDWSDRIEEAIEKCDFFLPVLSSEADARREGVFWDEWQTALERARRIKDAYLLPVGIDEAPASKDRYRRISDGDTALFFQKHLIHAPGGNLSSEDRESLSERCRRFQEESHG